ncbi:OsmC family peroxiredoxin [Chryseotalea sanaruensis]|uniref:OsmC family peroxiredoxin n=2 Tax=Chryseotalea sanaruensis TaxID=2482724 RepID=A0A401UCR4_9BACT|nr:OsmC family peroxiredoxin [Chryseotalea sanaruensis]
MEEKVAVATIGQEIYKTELVARTHTIVADEPLDVGGKDLGPRPGDFLRMSLASCTAITLRMYANRKNFDVQEIKVTVASIDVEGGTGFETLVEVKGKLDEQQHERMLQIAKLCPVHKVLTNPIKISTSLAMIS